MLHVQPTKSYTRAAINQLPLLLTNSTTESLAVEKVRCKGAAHGQCPGAFSWTT